MDHKAHVRLVEHTRHKSLAGSKPAFTAPRSPETHYRTASERRAEGKALREKVPREEHAG